MLETLLWTPFITQTTTNVGTTGFYIPFISQPTSTPGATVLRIGDIFEQKALRFGEANGRLPNSYAGNSEELASRPNATKNLWISLTREDLAQTNQAAADVGF